MSLPSLPCFRTFLHSYVFTIFRKKILLLVYVTFLQNNIIIIIIVKSLVDQRLRLRSKNTARLTPRLKDVSASPLAFQQYNSAYASTDSLTS